MKRRRAIITQKKRVFLGCEGLSEVAYGQLLNDILRSGSLPVHIVVESLAPAGGPLARVQKALKILKMGEKQRTRFWRKAILMDSDQAASQPHVASNARELANEHDIKIIWQTPCHEALMLRHLPGFEGNRPPTSSVAENALQQHWPEYNKPMTRAQLGQRINLTSVRRAAAVEPDLHEFLNNIGLLS